MTTTTGLITTKTRYIAPADETQPALAVHVTRLVDSYMVWVGTTTETAATVGNAPLSGSLCKDWACAMPPAPGSGVVGATTTVYRTGASEMASGMAERLARRFGEVVFVSVDVGDDAGVGVVAERGVVDALMALRVE